MCKISCWLIVLIGVISVSGQAQNEMFACENNQGDFWQHKRLKDIVPLNDTPTDTILYGSLYVHQDFGMFTMYWYSTSIESCSFTFKVDSVFYKKGTRWGNAKFTMQKGEKPKIRDFKQDEVVPEKTNKALEQSAKWWYENRNKFDANRFKKTDRYTKWLHNKINLSDFNTAKFEPRKKVLFFDYENDIVGIDMGRQVLKKDSRWGHFLSYIVIYNLQHKKVERVLVRNTGYFLE